MAFPRFQLWGLPIWGGKEENEKNFNVCASNSNDYSNGFGVREIENVKFPLKGTTKMANRKVKKKWQSREERRIDREHDGVMVPIDGICYSGSESSDSDWSIGWLEPHGPDFLSDDETDDSFAVLVPCYRNDRRVPVEVPNGQFLSTIKNLTSDPFAEGKNLMDQWLSSLQNF